MAGRKIRKKGKKNKRIKKGAKNQAKKKKQQSNKTFFLFLRWNGRSSKKGKEDWKGCKLNCYVLEPGMGEGMGKSESDWEMRTKPRFYWISMWIVETKQNLEGLNLTVTLSSILLSIHRKHNQFKVEKFEMTFRHLSAFDNDDSLVCVCVCVNGCWLSMWDVDLLILSHD